MPSPTPALAPCFFYLECPLFPCPCVWILVNFQGPAQMSQYLWNFPCSHLLNLDVIISPPISSLVCFSYSRYCPIFYGRVSYLLLICKIFKVRNSCLYSNGPQHPAERNKWKPSRFFGELNYSRLEGGCSTLLAEEGFSKNLGCLLLVQNYVSLSYCTFVVEQNLA